MPLTHTVDTFGPISKGDLLEAWDEGNQAGARAVDLFAEEIASGELGTFGVADLAGLVVDEGIAIDPLVTAFANGFLDIVDDYVLRHRPSAAQGGDWNAGYSNLQGE